MTVLPTPPTAVRAALSAGLVLALTVLGIPGGPTLEAATAPVLQEEGQAGEEEPADPEGRDGQETQEEPDDDEAADLLTRSEAEQRALDLVKEMIREEEGVLAGGDYEYRATGRRDPFRSLLQTTRQAEVPSVRPPGLAGLMIQEIQVKGIAEYLGRRRAILVAPDGRTHFAAVGAELFDGRVVEITETAVVFEQEVRDVLGARSTRRVVRRLRNEGQGE